MNTYTGHEGATARLSEDLLSGRTLTQTDAHALAQRYRREYDAILARHFRGLETSWETLLARLRWGRACSLVVDLSRKAHKPLEVMSGEKRQGHHVPGHYGPRKGRVA